MNASPEEERMRWMSSKRSSRRGRRRGRRRWMSSWRSRKSG